MPNALRFLLAGFDPRIWRPFVRDLRTSEGWWPPMFLIAVVGVAAFSAGFTRAFIIAKTCVYLWAIPWVIVSCFASALAFADSFRNLVRFGAVGFRRPRFWFEVARTSCIVGTLLAIATLIISLVELTIPDILGNASLVAIATCLASFFVASTIGYLVSVTTRRNAMGRAKECVNFFYPQVLGATILMCFVFAFPGNVNDPSRYVPVLALLVAICLAGATVVTLKNRWRRNSPPAIDNAR